jgi:sugar O-acyltransferase (sialic acid O-acetyltransferase NeuD family)
MKVAIIGYGGFASEVGSYIDVGVEYFVDSKYVSTGCKDIRELDFYSYKIAVAIADPIIRCDMIRRLPNHAQYFTYIHPTAVVGDNVKIGEGSIICPGVILTANIILGKHSHLNLLSTVGHDTIAGEFFTTAPGVKISGNCSIGDRVYFGTNSCVREKLSICDNVVVGMMSGVVKHITTPGTYVGTPAKMLYGETK